MKNLKKPYLLMVLLAVCVALYGIAEVYASISTVKAVPNSSERSISITSGYTTPCVQPIPRVYGDPIQDPRPKMARLPVIL